MPANACLIIGHQLRHSPQDFRENLPLMPVETFSEKCREMLRLKHFSLRTEQPNLPVIERFIECHGGKRILETWEPRRSEHTSAT